MVEVAVMYADLSIVRVPWQDKETLKRNDVIAVAVIQPSGKRYQARIENDFYQLIWTPEDSCLTGHNGDYGFFSLTEPGKADWRFPFIMPENSIEFEGETISSEDYKRAKEIFADSNSEMF